MLHSLAMLALCAMAGCGGPQYPNCNNDSHCHTGEFCVNGTCQRVPPRRERLPLRPAVPGPDGARPSPGYCSSSGDCPSGQECQNNRCVASQVTTSEPVDTSPGPCSLSPVYFGYDSSDLDGAARGAMQSNAQCIQQRDIQSVRLTGHCDPRGTEEYNLALGDRRARAAASYLQNLGVDRGRLQTRSMGEEMASGSDESSWARDRRVDFEER
ncbi:MAG: OmpA family protein [Sandaracinaceae bacterium]|nr:OmpA family protein [Sandaracinaceae bacterium]